MSQMMWVEATRKPSRYQARLGSKAPQKYVTVIPAKGTGPQLSLG